MKPFLTDPVHWIYGFVFLVCVFLLVACERDRPVQTGVSTARSA
jgi:hypothetical protein